MIYHRFIQTIIILLNRLLILFSLRTVQEHWGFVYDSVTKQPLDPVMIKLIYVPTGRAVASVVTDMGGRYGFLVKPGKFKILAKKESYRFPSQIVEGDTDGVYTHLYHGELFEVLGEPEVIAFNIPMDPLNFDWNQRAKIKYIKSSPYVRLFSKQLISIIFWFGLILSVMFWVHDFVGSLRLLLTWPTVVIGCYLFMFFLNSVIPRVRLWGQVLDKKTKLPVEGLVLELINPQVPTVVLSKAKTTFDGKFFMRSSKGKFSAVCKYLNQQRQLVKLAPITLKVPKEGVVNGTFYISLDWRL